MVIRYSSTLGPFDVAIKRRNVKGGVGKLKEHSNEMMKARGSLHVSFFQLLANAFGNMCEQSNTSIERKRALKE